MAIPTVAQVVAEIQDLLGDPSGKVITSAVATKGYERAYRRLRDAMLRRQMPFTRKQVTYSLPANTSSLLPFTAGISDFGELVLMEERATGTSDDYAKVHEREPLPQRDSAESLGEVEWREDTWYFTPATTARDLRITYHDNAAPPVSGSVGIDGSMEFLSLYGAAKAGPTKGYVEEAREYMVQAVGSALDDRDHGALFRLMQPMVRSLQRISPPLQWPAYGVGRSSREPKVLHIAAPLPQSNMVHLSLTGTKDGANPTFTLSATPNYLQLFRNGQLLSQDIAYTRVGNVVTFLPPHIPTSEDVLEAYGFGPSASGSGATWDSL